MTAAIPAASLAQILDRAGWRQFFLDSNLHLIPPFDALVELTGHSEKSLQTTLLTDLFSMAEHHQLEVTWSGLTGGQIKVSPTLSVTVTVHGRLQPAEIILFSPETGLPKAPYVGLIRLIRPATTASYASGKQIFHLQTTLNKIIADASTLPSLLDDLVATISKIQKYQHISIFTADTSETMLTLGAGSTVPPVDPAGHYPAYLVPVGDNSTVGQVAASLNPHHFDSRAERRYDTPGHYPFEAQSGLVIPIIANRQLLGVIDVSSPQPACFDDTEQWFFQAIAGQLAIKFENMRLLEKQERRLAELAAFNQIGMILAEHRDIETILTHTLQRVKSLFQVEGISLLLLEDNELRFAAAAGAEAEALKTHSLKPGQGIAWSVIESGKTIRVDNAKEDPRHFSGIDSAIEFLTSSLIAVPIRAAGRILGVLEAMNRLDGQPFNHDDEVTLEFIVSFVAIAIENARLFMQIQRQVDRTTGLLEASRTLGTLNLQDTLNTIVQQAGSLLEAEHTVVYSVDKANKKIRASAAHSIGEMINVPTPTFNFGEGTAGWVIANNESLVINNTQNDERFVHISPYSKLIGNLVTVPLTVQDEVIGALEACHKISKKRFGAEDESLLAAFANQAAIAIHNAQLYQEKQQRIEALTMLSQASEAITKAPNLDTLLNTVLDSMMAIIGAKAGSVILAETQSLVLSIEAARGITPEVIAYFNKQKLSKSADLLGDAHPLREWIEVDDGETAPLVSPQGPSYESTSSPFTHVPLYSSDDFIGLIELHGLPTDNTRSLLRTVADMAAVAIDKARLFRETGQRLAEVSTLYTLAEQTTRVLDLARIIEFTVIIIKHAVGCDGCGLFIKEVDEKEETLTLKASNGWSEANLRREGFTFVTELARQLSKKSHPTYITDIQEHYFSEILELAFTKQVDEEIKQAITEQFRSLMIVPLISKDRILGAFVISDSTPDAFGQSEGRLLTIAAAQIATAIENLKLYGNLEQRAIELEVALEEVEEANRLKSEFVQNVSHELRTPLTFILSYIELILEGSLGDVPPLILEKMEIVSQKTQMITRLVEDIISLQKMDAASLQLRTVTPHELVTRARHGAVANAAQLGIEITSDSTPNLPKLSVDVDRIGQVFDNLVANALKFSPSGTKIHIGAEQDGDTIKFSIHDQGIGIPSHKMDKVFERFYQVDGSTTRRYSGAGLGLAIIKQIIEIHNGRITVDSVVNQGTTFTFWLPIHEE